MKTKTKFNLKLYFEILLIVFIIIAFFTLIDYLVHSLSEEYAVPGYYFTNKLIFGTFWGFVVYLFVRKFKPLIKSIVFSAFIAIILQVRYFLEGYPIKFVLEFLVYHFLMLLVASFIIFKLLEKPDSKSY